MIKRPLILIVLVVFTIVGFALDVTSTPADRKFELAAADKAEVTAKKLNVRTGPGTNFPSVAVLSRGEGVAVIGSLGDWYVVQLADNSIGVVYSDHLKALSLKPVQTPGEEAAVFANGASDDEQALLKLINDDRAKNNLPPYPMDGGLNEAAKIKASEMAEKNYFSHNSPVYGSPFEMLKKFGITYKSAGENIAGNKTVSGAHREIMNSPFHRCNILNNRFNRIGIGIADHEKYGKIIVQIFTEQY